MMDFVETVDRVKPDIFVVNSDGGSDTKRQFCAERGIEYIELERVPDAGLEARSTTSLRKGVTSASALSHRPCGHLDRPAIREPLRSRMGTHREHRADNRVHGTRRHEHIHTQCGKKIWPYELP